MALQLQQSIIQYLVSMHSPLISLCHSHTLSLSHSLCLCTLTSKRGTSGGSGWLKGDERGLKKKRRKKADMESSGKEVNIWPSHKDNSVSVVASEGPFREQF